MSRRFPSLVSSPLTSSLSGRHPLKLSKSARYASTYPSYTRSFLSTTLLLGTGGILVVYYYDSRSIMHEHVAMPLLRLVTDPESGHVMALRMLGLSRWARPRDMGVDGEELSGEVSSSLSYPNPISHLENVGAHVV